MSEILVQEKLLFNKSGRIVIWSDDFSILCTEVHLLRKPFNILSATISQRTKPCEMEGRQVSSLNIRTTCKRVGEIQAKAIRDVSRLHGTQHYTEAPQTELSAMEQQH